MSSLVISSIMSATIGVGCFMEGTDSDFIKLCGAGILFLTAIKVLPSALQVLAG
ncbi:hypothetical protein [Bacillus thuringiensis]|uniref:hypothetical protein n=1 Tax=Bacillus thuringiensis TaxID=1428 RepID=UPI00159BB846|nr:hypothetical protein [Bacillus thuringiensis]